MKCTFQYNRQSVDEDQTMSQMKEVAQFPTTAAASMSLEPYVDTSVAAGFLGLHPVTVMRLARAGAIPVHPVKGTRRKQWRFLLSELSTWLASRGAND